jgi:hypothetical protein
MRNNRQDLCRSNFSKGGQMKKLMILAVAMVAMGFAETTHASYVVIDNFEDGQILTTTVTTSSPLNDTQSMLPGVLGGTRTLDVVATTDYADVTLNKSPQAPKPQLAVVAGTTGKITSTLTYNFSATDLTTDGADSFIILATSDHDSLFTIYVTDSSNRTIGEEFVIPEMQSPGNLVFSFASFYANPLNTPAYNPGFSSDLSTVFTSVTSIVLQIRQSPVTDAGLDFTLSNIRTGIVPEPTSLALAGFASIGMAVGAIRRRRQAKQAA